MKPTITTKAFLSSSCEDIPDGWTQIFGGKTEQGDKCIQWKDSHPYKFIDVAAGYTINGNYHAVIRKIHITDAWKQLFDSKSMETTKEITVTINASPNHYFISGEDIIAENDKWMFSDVSGIQWRSVGSSYIGKKVNDPLLKNLYFCRPIETKNAVFLINSFLVGRRCIYHNNQFVVNCIYQSGPRVLADLAKDGVVQHVQVNVNDLHIICSK